MNRIYQTASELYAIPRELMNDGLSKTVLYFAKRMIGGKVLTWDQGDTFADWTIPQSCPEYHGTGYSYDHEHICRACMNETDYSQMYGYEIVSFGRSPKEVLISAYCCHNRGANDNCSGMAVAFWLYRYLIDIPHKYTYRFAFFPETVGAIFYLQQIMLNPVIAGYTLSCIGDDGPYTMTETPYGNTLADKVAKKVLARKPNPIIKSFLKRGSDERQYCSPRVGWPVVSLGRSQYEGYPEYHTEKDDLSVISPEGLQGGFDFVKECIEELENTKRYISTTIGEPCMGKRGLYQKDIMDVLAYCDGRNDADELAAITGVDRVRVDGIIERLLKEELIEEA